MSDNSEKAAGLHQQGANCCQAVVAALCEKYGVDKETAMRMGAGFGGGMRRGEVCGAVTGGLMVLGLKDGARVPEDQDAKAAAYAKTSEFMKTFEEQHGSCLCRELLKASGRKICDKLIADSVELLEKMGY